MIKMHITTHDLEADGKKYILEWTHSDDGNGFISITESIDQGAQNAGEVYDFVEFLG